ncbi:DUF3846 domain-containing protein [Oscillospiraceae bacterium OttesenSCG-928-G22]|nr:DUF3846 domain-containing protein [Oscillospiraceae bacterium OttesenSCG-928-G22]
MPKTINVLIVEPEKAPYMKEIDASLKSMQDVVGGYIEAAYPYDDYVAIVCNEEGKMMGLPLNRILENYDIIAGTFFVCGLSESNFASLPPELIDKYAQKFTPCLVNRDGRYFEFPQAPNAPKQSGGDKNTPSKGKKPKTHDVR